MSAYVFDCPQCGAAVKFQSSISVFAICGYCRSMVVRRTADVEALGVMAELPPDLSPLQLGSRGQWQGEPFELVGRIRMQWEQGSWNEWHALFANGKSGWVAESQGFFTVSMERFDRDLPASVAAYEAGREMRFVDCSWTVVDVKTAVCVAAEGELPFAAPAGAKRLSADMADSDGAFATVEFSLEERPQLYVGRYATFEELQFESLRPVPGWSAEAEAQRHQTGALNCVECGAPVSLRAIGHTMSAVCSSCGAVMDTSAPLLQLIQIGDARVRKLNPLLPIGTRGKLAGVEWEVIGFMTRIEGSSTWAEYLLFNPWKGFRWLVNFEGHWSVVDRLLKTPTQSGSQMRLAGERFDLFSKGKAKVRGVLGEFYWKVQRGEETVVFEYIRPPRILSSERYPELQEVTWSVGEYVSREVIGEAFGVKNLPAPRGVYLNQPNPHAERWESLRSVCLILVALFLIIQVGSCTAMNPRNVYAGKLAFDRADPTKVEVTPSFSLVGPVQIEASAADLSNSWVGMDVTLVNAKTNVQFFATIDLEYYSGVEAGEAWSEGSRTRSVMLPGVPPGDYYLTVESDADTALQKMPYTLRVNQGGVFWSNFWIGLFAVLIYPLSVRGRASRFERERWEESDYSPYASDSDD